MYNWVVQNVYMRFFGMSQTILKDKFEKIHLREGMLTRQLFVNVYVVRVCDDNRTTHIAYYLQNLVAFSSILHLYLGKTRCHSNK